MKNGTVPYNSLKISIFNYESTKQNFIFFGIKPSNSFFQKKETCIKIELFKYHKNSKLNFDPMSDILHYFSYNFYYNSNIICQKIHSK